MAQLKSYEDAIDLNFQTKQRQQTQESTLKKKLTLDKLQRSIVQVGESVHRTTISHALHKSHLIGTVERRTLVISIHLFIFYDRLFLSLEGVLKPMPAVFGQKQHIPMRGRHFIAGPDKGRQPLTFTPTTVQSFLLPVVEKFKETFNKG